MLRWLFGYFITLYRLPWSCGSIELDANSTFNMTINGKPLILMPCVALVIRWLGDTTNWLTDYSVKERVVVSFNTMYTWKCQQSRSLEGIRTIHIYSWSVNAAFACLVLNKKSSQ